MTPLVDVALYLLSGALVGVALMLVLLQLFPERFVGLRHGSP